MFPISSTQSSLFQSIRYSTTEMADQRICVDSLRHQRSDYSIMVALFRSGLLLQNLAHFKIIDEDMNSHMERNGEFALAGYFQNARLQVQPLIYTKRPVPMHPVDSDRGRHVIIEESLAPLLPITSIDLVNNYAEDHESFFTDPDMWSGSDNCSLKRKTLRKAIERGEQAVLNEVFEELRQSNQPVDLSWVDLSGLNLTGLNLFGVILVSANLTDTNLTRVDLRQADLSDADLTGANLFDAALNSAVLTRADLTLANCEQADLSDASLFEAIFHRTNLRCAWLLGSNLSGASMCGTNLNRAVLQGADLHNADLSGSAMANTNLFQANLSGACLAFCHLAHANLMYANLTETNLQSACLFNARLHKATMDGACFWLANLALASGYDEIPDQFGKATAQLSRFPSMTTSNHRRSVTHQALSGQLPTSLIDLIRAYEGHTDSGRLHTFAEKSNRTAAHFRNPEMDYAPVSDIETRCRSREFVIHALRSGDVRLKGQIIRTLVSQNKIGYLNKVFQKLRSSHGVFSLAHIDLSTLNLSNLDLSHADLGGANLSSVTLDFNFMSNFSLAQSNLAGAVISNSHLRQVMLARSDLSGARFENCTIEASWLDEVNLTDSTLCAEFFQVDMRNVDFSRAKFKFASIVESDLSGASMEHAVLNGVHIRDSVLKNVKLDNVRLIDTSKNRTVITDPAQLTD